LKPEQEIQRSKGFKYQILDIELDQIAREIFIKLWS